MIHFDRLLRRCRVQKNLQEVAIGMIGLKVRGKWLSFEKMIAVWSRILSGLKPENICIRLKNIL